MIDFITKRVHQLYWEDNLNCARTTLICLSELFNVSLAQQTICAAIGLHGAGKYRAQCGIVEGGLMFIALYMQEAGNKENDIVVTCYNFAEKFEKEFSSLRCFELRPTGFSDNDPPHLCENLTCKGIEFISRFITNNVPGSKVIYND